MGQLRFRVPNAQSYDSQIWSTAFVSGIEGIPWASRNWFENDCLVIDRSVDERRNGSIHQRSVSFRKFEAKSKPIDPSTTNAVYGSSRKLDV